MTRGVGVTELLTELPTAVVVGFAVLTQLGDFWFVATVSLLTYWLASAAPVLGDGLTRERAAMVLALLAAAVAVAVSLKVVFAFPRPPNPDIVAAADGLPWPVGAFYESVVTGRGYGFPSGHATTTVLVWGGFAWALRIGRRRQRYAVAGAVVVVVSLSRLVLGVHYLADVVAGAAIAAAVLWAAVTKLGTPERVFAFAALVALGGVVAGGVTRDTAAALGLAVGGLAAWTALDEVPEPTRRGSAVTAVLGAASLGSLAGAVVLLQRPPAGAGVAAALGMALALVLPLVGERVAKKWR
ncbi:phosphatase PAP2 family protein [Haloarcula onubensis]|uniref:Phosphatase PAP2 family protein n=1 Tax=Haloarcula onubensis TaxID=2950539 RepID=A0ABU2FPZ0_9EURY|nr:phosphatase PAP2 family protein [Halomicroarcula sp. S3CR25-11]MDS0282824.1 phosphatase PAP2 family protein [Halomicroarcula sp. S3CR25-11]